VNSLGTARGHLIAGVGGIVLVISLFLEWVDGRFTGWQAFTVVDIVMTAIGVLAIVYAILPAMGTEPSPGLALGVAAAGMAAFGFAAGWELELPSGAGVYLSVLGAAGITWGSYDAGRHLWTPIPRPTRRDRHRPPGPPQA
jgi:hypothetical protein